MFLLDWYREWIEIRLESKIKRTEIKHEEVICQSCETLKKQLEIANYEKRQLLDKLLAPPPIIEEKPPIPVSIPRSIPWNVRKQMLEREDSEKAKLMRDAPKPDSIISTEELEKELNLAAKTREAEAH